MSVFPKAKFSIVDFSTRYSSEESCREQFLRLRFPHGFVCPHCGGSQLSMVRTRGLYRCKSCRKQISATSGTVFHGTHIKLNLWLWAMYLFTVDKRGRSAVQLMTKLSVTYKTAWYILHRLCIAMSHRESRYLPDGILELDDSVLQHTAKSADEGLKKRRSWSPFQSQRKAIRDTQKWR